METKSIQQFMNSYSVKMILVSFLAIVLLIPSFMIQEVIQERMDLHDKVKKELHDQWGGQQVLAGPVLNVPYTLNVVNEHQQVNGKHSGVAHFLPETLTAEGVLNPETRQRGIYKVVVYESKLKLKAVFASPDVYRLDLQDAVYDWDAAYFTLGITDLRGIRNLPEPLINGQAFEVEPGVADTDLFQQGITLRAPGIDLREATTFEMALNINGSGDFSVEPLGKTSSIKLQSAWSEPGFTGAFLPADRNIGKDGFTAAWEVNHLNRNYPQQWPDAKFKTQASKLGVSLLIPVDHYQKSMRSAKYAILFIALNFIVFIFFELKSKIRIHPFQYTLVALALLLFYALLTSIGEQIGFNLAYLIAATAVTLLIAWYTQSIAKNKKLLAWMIVLQSGLYLFLYAILQMEEYALLTGSIGLFVILAILMRASKKVKWYAEDEG
jgi:inner membrane protein